jgi:ATP-dependent helicase/nuclease subunit A
MSSAWVGTFHSICARILRSFPLEAGIDPGFEVVDEVDATALKSRAFTEALSRLLDSREDDEDLARTEQLISGLGLDRLGEEIRDAYDELRSRGIAEPRLPTGDLPTAYPAKLVDRILGLAKTIAFDPDRKNNAPKKKARTLVEHLGDDGRELTLELAEESQSKSRDDAAINELAALLDEAAGKLVAIADGDFTYRTVSHLLELYGAAYSRLKELDSLLDFEDLQIRTRDLLRNGALPVGDYYRGRFREIMVDEFQDTNGLQLDLIDALRGEGTTLMTVGDELQSIYRFRHANVQIFRDRGRDLPDEGRLEMKGNNRSDRTVLDAVNGLGLALDRETRERRAGSGESRHSFTELEQGRASTRGPGLDGSVRMLLIERGDWGPLHLGEIAPARERGKEEESRDQGAPGDAPEEPAGKVERVEFIPAEAMAVAQDIRRLVDQGVSQRDVVILLRAMSRSHWYEQALRQVGLTPYTMSGRGFWDSDQVQVLVALLRIVANPLDEDSLLTGMLSPACGVSADVPLILRRGAIDRAGLWDTALAAVAGDEGRDDWLTRIEPEDGERLGSFCEAIGQIRTRAATLPLDELVEELTVLTGYDLAALERDPTAIADIKRVASIARGYEERHSRNLRGFLDWADASRAEDKEAQVATEDERSDVVRIMTVHAAKGAQFEAVFVPDLGRKFQGDRRSLLLLGPSRNAAEPEDFEVGIKVGDRKAYDWNSIFAEARSANEDEELRLFHVALTRACGQLVLSGCPQMNNSITETTSIADRLCEILRLPSGPLEGKWENDPASEDLAGLIDVSTFPANGESADLLALPHEAISGRETDGPASFPPLSRPVARAYPEIPLSFTALGEFRACPLQFFAKRVLRLSEDGHWPFGGPEAESTGRRGDGATFGTAVHALIEAAAGDGWKAPDRDHVAAALRAEGMVARESVELAEGMIAGLLESELMAELDVQGAKAEVPIILNVDEVVIRGFIDLLVPGDSPLVVDFKTNRLEDRSPEEYMEGEYGLQRDLYALAVSEAEWAGPAPETVRTAFVFLGGSDGPVAIYRDYERAELEQAKTEVRELVRQIITPAEPGIDSRPDGCGECWACARLAS